MPLYLRKLPESYGDCRSATSATWRARAGARRRSSTPAPAGVLNVTSHFFEFVPEEQRDDPDAEFLTADQLESNREYFIYFTTSAGLYRYDINDVVRVVDFYRNTPVIQFVRKGQGMTIDHRREADRVAGDRGARRRRRLPAASTSSTSPPASSGASRRATRSTPSSATR